MSNYIFGAVLILFSIFAYKETLNIEEHDAALFPTIIVVAIGITGILLIIDEFIRKKVAHNKGGEDYQNNTTLTFKMFVTKIAIPGLLMIGAYFLITIVGYYITSFLLIIVIYTYHTYLSDKSKITLKHFGKSLLFSGVAVGVMYVLFTILIGLPTPSGSLINF
ncbi:tripartite tricarboxylate transporter TctB family protein [Gracilibacillus boraciitolerans]|uniref:tripartite tricarboxylate transporter TctB family protein n=1 Tax=Gracilibacillus boraciitolerans TaxID=307521 RepID=UPI00055500E4|nr:tripartite tricarboxylate transporter TctB family protein [Gracilibacillus boraciitolerans]